MKRKRKTLSVAAAIGCMLIFFGMLPSLAAPESTIYDGIHYEFGVTESDADKISAQLVLSNQNVFGLQNVSLEILPPEGYALQSVSRELTEPEFASEESLTFDMVFQNTGEAPAADSRAGDTEESASRAPDDSGRTLYHHPARSCTDPDQPAAHGKECPGKGHLL